jgi:uncharacterized protein (UPF0332 family)
LGKGIPLDFKDCKDFGRIVPPAPPTDAVKKDMQEAFNDISYAKKSLSDDNYKWAIAQAYYSMYLSARAALFSKGYSIKKVNSHLCLAHFISRLVELKQLKSIYSNDFMVAMDSREKANYDAVYSKEDAEKEITRAEEFIKQMDAVIANSSIRV